MLIECVDQLVSPRDGGELKLESFRAMGREVDEGVLRDGSGAWFPIIDGLAIFPSPALQPDLGAFAAAHGLHWSPSNADHRGQVETNQTFSDKWRRFRNYGMEPDHQAFLQEWYVKKLGLSSRSELAVFYRQFARVLEVGPGSGFNLKMIAENCPGSVYGLDISEAARTSLENVRGLRNATVVQADLFEAPFADDTFDFVIADGVLHHTPDTREAVGALYRKVKPGGKFFFYVYRQMGAARYFVDKHIRKAFTQLDPEACYEACRPITELGRQLSKLGQTIKLDEPIPVLGLPAGEHDVQRFFYYGFMKCFWNDAFDFETNNMVNFDWYHPHHAWQHTDEEVIGWLNDLGVQEYSLNDANPNGISVLLTKPMSA